MTILNLTQHNASLAQVAAGVVEPANKVLLQELLTFTELPDKDAVMRRANAITNLCVNFEGHTGKVMIGGAPFLMGPLTAALKAAGCEPVFAFSQRESVDQELEDGTVIKKSIFVHMGFVEA